MLAMPHLLTVTGPALDEDIMTNRPLALTPAILLVEHSSVLSQKFVGKIV
jgi:hypothetical protein